MCLYTWAAKLSQKAQIDPIDKAKVLQKCHVVLILGPKTMKFGGKFIGSAPEAIFKSLFYEKVPFAPKVQKSSEIKKILDYNDGCETWRKKREAVI